MATCSKRNPGCFRTTSLLPSHHRNTRASACRSNGLHGAAEEGRGARSVLSSTQSIAAPRWLHSSVMHTDASCTGQSPPGVALRWSKEERKVLNAPKGPFLRSCNRRSRSHDQCVSTYPHRRNKQKLRFFYFFSCTSSVAPKDSIQKEQEPAHLLLGAERFGSGNHGPASLKQRCRLHAEKPSAACAHSGGGGRGFPPVWAGPAVARQRSD